MQSNSTRKLCKNEWGEPAKMAKKRGEEPPSAKTNVSSRAAIISSIVDTWAILQNLQKFLAHFNVERGENRHEYR